MNKVAARVFFSCKQTGQTRRHGWHGQDNRQNEGDNEDEKIWPVTPTQVVVVDVVGAI